MLNLDSIVSYREDIDTTDIDGDKGPEFPLHISCEEEALQILTG